MFRKKTTPYFYFNTHYVEADGRDTDIVMTAGSSAFSFSLWYYRDPASSIDTMVPIELTNSVRGDGVFFQINQNPTTSTARVATLGANTGDQDIGWSLGKWEHFGIVYDQSATTVEMWRDGVLRYSNTSYTEQSSIAAGDARIRLGNQ